MALTLEPEQPDPLRAAMEERCKDMREKIAKRKNQAGFASNVEAMETALAEMERLLNATKGEG